VFPSGYQPAENGNIDIFTKFSNRPNYHPALKKFAFF